MRESEDELVRVDELLTLAYGTASRRAELDLYLRAEPTSWRVAEQHGQLRAVAGCLAYGAFAWLGLVATHPAARGRGLATRVSSELVEWALAQGCASIALDASTTGRPVYERLGFIQVGETAELLRPETCTAPLGERAEPATAGDLEEIIAFDRTVFGGDRASLLRAVAGSEGSWFVIRTPTGNLGGYLVARAQGLGPAAALDERALRRLVHSALDSPSGRRVLLPAESDHRETLLDLGFVEQRRLAHMRFGELALGGERSRLAAELSYATG